MTKRLAQDKLVEAILPKRIPVSKQIQLDPVNAKKTPGADRHRTADELCLGVLAFVGPEQTQISEVVLGK
jgi:hypothetical protein